jgi:uncharacterized protein with von Willebrand factor type A (vWA) domain
MLPAGMTLDEAAAGPVIAALNVSKNRNLSFVELKQAMTVDGLSLGQAARQLPSTTPATRRQRLAARPRQPTTRTTAQTQAPSTGGQPQC